MPNYRLMMYVEWGTSNPAAMAQVTQRQKDVAVNPLDRMIAGCRVDRAGFARFVRQAHQWYRQNSRPFSRFPDFWIDSIIVTIMDGDRLIGLFDIRRGKILYSSL